MMRRAPEVLLLAAAALALLAADGARPARQARGQTASPQAAGAATPSPTPTPDPKLRYELEKLEQEARGLRIANEAYDTNAKWMVAWITALGGIVVALFVAGAGILVNRAQNRKLEQDKRLGRVEHLLKVFHDLGDSEPRIRIGAVAVLAHRVADLTRQVNSELANWQVVGVRWPDVDPEEVREVPTIISVLISVTKHEQSVEIQKYIADGIAEGLDAILDPGQESMGSRQPPKYPVSPLRRYDFQGAQLQNAWWYSIDARGVDFYKANLSRAGLRNSLLSEAVLKKADLTSAVLQGADLTGANLEGALLVNTNLKNARLVNAKLDGADLSGAKLEGADVTGVIFDAVKNLHAAHMNGAVGYTPPAPASPASPPEP